MGKGKQRMESDLVSIITVNYNGYEDTCALIESLRSKESFPYELIVVDNASQRNEAALLQKNDPDMTVIRSEENLGFAGGNNLGLSYARGNYILFLNNDIEIDAPFLEQMVNCFKKDPTIGIVSPKIKYGSAKQVIQYAGFAPLSPVTLRNWIIGTGEVDTGQYDVPSYTAYAHGACMMTTWEVLHKVGPMSEVFFLFYEELDWSQRVKRAGYTIWYEPSAVVFHKEGMSISKGTPLRNYYLVRGRLLYARRNCRGMEKCLSGLYQSLVALGKGGIAFLRGERALARSYGKAVWDGLRGQKETEVRKGFEK